MKELSLFSTLPEASQETSGPVTCLGMTFENDEARRAYFTEELRKKLQDPEFRKIEGFPIGSDGDILTLSDPPYYTTCPNPWIADFIAEWEAQKPKQSEGYHYHREPFAADVSEGKSDPIYNAHSYHTKVPHKAIMRYILHYTEPGDIVFDGFCGTGMTGVAAQMCGNREAIMSLGYQVKPDGTILQEETDEEGKKIWRPFSKLGGRRAVLNDLSPKDDPTLAAKARDRWYVPDPRKAGDLEKLREKALLKEFEEYKEAKKKLKVFRLEAVRAGFKKAWQERDYAVIIAVAEKLPTNVMEEDPKLLMWYDQAVTRMGGE